MLELRSIDAGYGRFQALFGVAQALGIKIEFLLIMTQTVHRLLQLHLRGFQHV